MQPNIQTQPIAAPERANAGIQTDAWGAGKDFTTLVEKQSPLVLGVCRRMLPDALAEDAAQAVFILLWKKGKGLQGDAVMASWLYRTAIHVCRNARRMEIARLKHEQKAVAKEPRMSADGPELAKWNEIRAVLDEEVDRLPEKWRIPFVLFHFENRSLAQIGEVLNATQSTVGTWLQRSRDQLAAKLTRRGISVSGAVLAGILLPNLSTQAMSRGFVVDTVKAAHGFSLTGASAGSACSPLIASLVQSSMSQGIGAQAWLKATISMLMVMAVPLAAFFLFPLIQTRQSPDFLLLQGEWREISNEQGGAMVSATPPVGYVGTLRISGNQFHRFSTLADGKVLQGEKGTFVLDDRTHPKSIDFTLWFRSVYAIYEIDGDHLTLCTSQGGEKRPTEMTTSQGDNRILNRYERVR